MAQLVLNDLLGVNGGAESTNEEEGGEEESLLNLLYSSKNASNNNLPAEKEEAIKETILLLLHSLSLTVDGRSYLLSVSGLLDRLIQFIQATPASANNLAHDRLAQQALGVLQKLSGRYSVQQRLVQSGILDLLFDTLRTDDHDVLDNDELMEYMTSIIMNLVVLPEGKRYRAQQADKYASVLISLMEHPNLQVSVAHIYHTLLTMTVSNRFELMLMG